MTETGMLEIAVMWIHENGGMRRTVVQRVQNVTVTEARKLADKFKDRNQGMQTDAMFRPAYIYL